MRRIIFYLLCILSVSCSRKEIFKGDSPEPTPDKTLDLSFNFRLKTEVSLSVKALSGENAPGEGVLFGVYLEPPYSGDGCIGETTPVYIGYTDANGQLNDKFMVPGNASTLYVVPLTAGYGAMQSVDVQERVALEFEGVAFEYVASAAKVSLTEEDIVGRCEFTKISNLYDLYVPYRDSELGRNGIPLVGGSALVSQENVSPQLVNLINSWYPEKQNVVTEDLTKSPDLVVTDDNGAEVWVTYIGDGGFYVDNRTTYNTLAYYNYHKGDLTGRDDVSDLHMTLILPNTNQLHCPQGLKVQLLYWDGEKYHTIFPKGTRIGFAVARDGFANNGKSVTANEAYKFKDVGFPQAVTNRPEGFYYSTPVLNAAEPKTTQAIIRANPDNNCCIMGFDIRRTDDPRSDFDFNDVIMKVTSSPVLAVKPEEEIPWIEEVVPTEFSYGTLAFEDQWPSKGDYDFNDFVVNYAYGLAKDEKNRITHIRLDYTPIAKGAAAYTRIGFGVELPVESAAVELKPTGEAYLEAGNEKATVIVWENVNTAFGKNDGYLNTKPEGVSVTCEPTSLQLAFKTPVDYISLLKMNPFIFVNGRSCEIHLVDHAPTAHMDFTLFGTKNDLSKPDEAIYYRMDNFYPWVLDFPRSSAQEPAWRYPREEVNITEAYHNYEKWVYNKTDISWFDASIPGNVDEEKLY